VFWTSSHRPSPSLVGRCELVLSPLLLKLYQNPFCAHFVASQVACSSPHFPVSMGHVASSLRTLHVPPARSLLSTTILSPTALKGFSEWLATPNLLTTPYLTLVLVYPFISWDYLRGYFIESLVRTVLISTTSSDSLSRATSFSSGVQPKSSHQSIVRTLFRWLTAFQTYIAQTTEAPVLHIAMDYYSLATVSNIDVQA